SVHTTVPGQGPKRTNLSSGKPEAHQSIRMSLAGTNLPNELPFRVHHSTVRSRCAAMRTNVNLPGSWPRFASKFWRFSLPMNRRNAPYNLLSHMQQKVANSVRCINARFRGIVEVFHKPPKCSRQPFVAYATKGCRPCSGS